ncbi:hypothetical protein XI04_04695 [Bradyrhizobium sp. CCBAU 11430]|nr:hypothetical protein [Bradyrhizobium sp. CCBAU 11357]MDA9512361.1 hypothetical protein [Bradyrhizobium sp. CCBAU 11430]
MQREEIELGVQMDAINDEVGRLAEEIASIVVNEAALRLAERMERLAELRARHVTAEKDVPERRLQLREVDRAISVILQRVFSRVNLPTAATAIAPPSRPAPIARRATITVTICWDTSSA